MAYTNPNSSIFLTPFHKLKLRSLGEHSPDGNCATGKRNPLSLMKINCKTCVANWGSVLPVKRNKKKVNDNFGLMQLQFASQLSKWCRNSTYHTDLSLDHGPHQGQQTQPAYAFHALQPSPGFPKQKILIIIAPRRYLIFAFKNLTRLKSFDLKGALLFTQTFEIKQPVSPVPGVQMVGSGRKIRAQSPPVFSPLVSFCAGHVRLNLLPTI